MVGLQRIAIVVAVGAVAGPFAKTLRHILLRIRDAQEERCVVSDCDEDLVLVATHAGLLEAVWALDYAHTADTLEMARERLVVGNVLQRIETLTQSPVIVTFSLLERGATFVTIGK